MANRFWQVAMQGWQRLDRVTFSSRLIREIDGLRFLAIAPVVMMHLVAECARTYAAHNIGAGSLELQSHGLVAFATRWGVGVRLFFIVSGFILGLPFARYHLKGGERVGLKAYYLRRMTRLEPPYLLALVGIFAAQIVLKVASLQELWPHLAASALYLHNIVYGRWSSINPVAWSLEIEVQFYAMVPMLAWAYFSIGRATWRRMAALGGMIALATAAWVFEEAFRAAHLSKSLLFFGEFFLAGFVLADVHTTSSLHPPSQRSHLWDLAGILGIVGALALHGSTPWARLGTVASASMIFVAAFRGVFWQRLLTKPLVYRVGGMCYSIYLIHYALIHAGMRLSGSFGDGASFAGYVLLQSILLLPIVGLCTLIFYLGIERPCMHPQWPRRLWDKLVSKRDMRSSWRPSV